MPSGVYERKPKAGAPATDKPKRQYTRRAAPSEGVKGLALEAFTGAADNLAQVVDDTVDAGDVPELARALHMFKLCSKIYRAV